MESGRTQLALCLTAFYQTGGSHAESHHSKCCGRDHYTKQFSIASTARIVAEHTSAKQAIDQYATAANVVDGTLFRPINKGGRLTGERMTEQVVYNLVTKYAASLSIANLAPHDLRRTFAKPAHKGGSGLDQIQLSLGHSSIQTKERYLGIEQDLTTAPCDVLGLRLQ